jgi:hypothetical protein
MSEERSGTENANSQSGRAMRTLSYAALAGALMVILYALKSSGSVYFSVAGVGLLIGGAALLMGGVLGFLFGIPRTLQREVAGSESADERARVDYLANTNLEQISDWLTKIIVGVGLTQLTAMPEFLQRVSSHLAVGLGNQPSDPIFVLSLLLYFLAVGFLFGYLWTRLNLAGALRKADLESIGALVSRVEQTDRRVEEFRQQNERDAHALSLTYRWFNPSPDIPEATPEELGDAIAAASSPTRAQIFNQAWKIRAENWRHNKPLMERTIPVFRALIAADPERKYHTNHGQLGFALKDQTTPDWSEAERELSSAIEIRGPWQDGGWLFYEFNRAICRIMLDKAFEQDMPADAPTREKILSDLRAAWQSDLQQKMREEELFNRWRDINKIRLKDLEAGE